MSLFDFDEADERAADTTAFSNGTEADAWMARWCNRCQHEEECQLILVAMLGKTPAAWEEKDRLDLGHQYVCTAFEGPS
jgi:hypothetical protein